MRNDKRRQWRNPDGTIVSVWIERGAKVSRRAHLGDDTRIASGAEVRAATIGERVQIGRGSLVMDRAEVWDAAVLGRGVTVYPHGVVGAKSICEDGSTVLSGCVVSSGDTLQRGGVGADYVPDIPRPLPPAIPAVWFNS
jgi:UDP-3-O-[3-hydroxymyristoyl] glucosamine N-acyltransferase